MTAPSKMNNAQLRVALAEAKQDVKNTGSYLRGIIDNNSLTANAKLIGKNNDKIIEGIKYQEIIKELTDNLSERERSIEVFRSDRAEDLQTIADFRAKLTASDQQCQEYKSMAEHCGADEIKTLTRDRDEFEGLYRGVVENFKTVSGRMNKYRVENIDLQVKNKCLIDELAKFQNKPTVTFEGDNIELQGEFFLAGSADEIEQLKTDKYNLQVKVRELNRKLSGCHCCEGSILVDPKDSDIAKLKNKLKVNDKIDAENKIQFDILKYSHETQSKLIKCYEQQLDNKHF